MYNSLHKQIIFVVYDGVGNSVFHSMVLAPLLEMLSAQKDLEVTLVSFERDKRLAEKMIKTIAAPDNFHFVIMRKLPFLGKLSLWFGMWQLRRLFKTIPCHEIIARGPLAGWIVVRALERKTYGPSEKKPSVIIQARGLCAEEYRYAHIKNKETCLKRLYHQWVYSTLKRTEYDVYSDNGKAEYPLTIEAVSPALKEYLVKHFHADEAKIIIATRDLLAPIPTEQIMQWRTELRKQLGIMLDAYVYCYSGSYKPWQCADQTIDYFADLHDHEDKNFLLILTQDKRPFIRALELGKVPKNRWLVLSVTPDELMSHLAIADAGLLFREPDVINWVSRPTKMLEYQAVGLKIIHNNTVAWLTGK